MIEPIPNYEILKKAFELLNDYFSGNRERIKELEETIEKLDTEALEKLSKESPEKIIKYISQKVDLYLKIEDLKVKKETSLMNWVKNWSNVLIPILVAATTVLGVYIGSDIDNKKQEYQNEIYNQEKFEQQLILKVFETSDSLNRKIEIRNLINSGFINHYKVKLQKFINDSDNLSDSIASIDESTEKRPNSSILKGEILLNDSNEIKLNQINTK